MATMVSRTGFCDWGGT